MGRKNSRWADNVQAEGPLSCSLTKVRAIREPKAHDASSSGFVLTLIPGGGSGLKIAAIVAPRSERQTVLPHPLPAKQLVHRKEAMHAPG
jgi:hypothetical protein